MILADKIIENRKKNGWSQEELADKLGVSRQSVSKWEGAQAIPDMKKILQMADLFGVSTDYLLRDEIEEADAGESRGPEADGDGAPARRVSLEEANAFLNNNERTAQMVSTGVAMCILSPMGLLGIFAFGIGGKLSFNAAIAVMSGLIVLLLVVASALVLFISTAMRNRPYAYLKSQDIDTEYGVSGMVKEKKAAYAERHSKLMLGGTMLCSLSLIPFLVCLIAGRWFLGGDRYTAAIMVGISTLLIMVALGMRMIILTSIRQSGYDKLLEEGKYERGRKKTSLGLQPFDAIYYALTMAVYLTWSFLSDKWDITWIVWPIAGMLYVAYREVIKMLIRRRR